MSGTFLLISSSVLEINLNFLTVMWRKSAGEQRANLFKWNCDKGHDKLMACEWNCTHVCITFCKYSAATAGVFLTSLLFSTLIYILNSFVMSVCPYGTTRLPPDGFWLIWYLSFFFRKSVDRIQVSLKYGKIKGTLYSDVFAFMIISR
jgi:hypothetical protein